MSDIIEPQDVEETALPIEVLDHLNIVPPAEDTPFIPDTVLDFGDDDSDNDVAKDNELELNEFHGNNPIKKLVKSLAAYREPLRVFNVTATTAYLTKLFELYETKYAPFNNKLNDKIKTFSTVDRQKLTEADNRRILYSVLTPEERTVYKELNEEFAYIRELMTQGIYTSYVDGEHVDLLLAREQDFRQNPTNSSNRKIGIVFPKQDKPESNVLNGLKGLNYLSSIMNGGNSVRLPLWHTGISLTLRNFTIDQLTNFKIMQANMKESLGMETHGNIFNSDNVVQVSAVLEFILGNIDKSSLSSSDKDTILDITPVTDISTIITGAAAAIFPQGYPLILSCVASHKNNCDWKYKPALDSDGRIKPEYLLHLEDTLWSDTKIINAQLVDMMSAVSGSMSLEDVKAYKALLASRNPVNPERNIISNDDISLCIKFKVPSIREYMAAGTEYVASITDMVTQAMSMISETTEEMIRNKRIECINTFTNARKGSEYLPWISEIIIKRDGQEDMFVTNYTDFASTLQLFSQHDNFYENLFKEYKKFRDDSTISLVGYNNFKCPHCGANRTTDASEETLKLYNGKYPSIIPLNMVQVFLAIMDSM